nr:facilitated trehalose transporter Tret1-like [Leptinotarsa decemlineata]
MMKVSVRAILIALAGNLWLVLHFLAIYISLNIMSLEREDYVVTEKLSLQIYVVGAVKGSLFFCGLAHYLGRKNSISSTGLPLAVGYLLSFTENIGVFCCGRFLIGFSWGGTLAVLPIYFGEIATKSSRGIMLSTIVVSFQIGGILSMNINRFDSRIILKCVVPGLAVLFSIFFFFFGMETPHYYLLKNDKIISKSALEKLRNTTQNEIEKEFKGMQGDIIHTGEEKVMACFKANGWVKSVFVLLCLNFLQSLSVVNFMRILATEVFDRAGFNITVPQMFMIVDEFNLQQVKSKVYLQFDTKYTGHNNVSLRRRWQIALRPTKKAKKFRKDVEELEKLCTGYLRFSRESVSTVREFSFCNIVFTQ